MTATGKEKTLSAGGNYKNERRFLIQTAPPFKNCYFYIMRKKTLLDIGCGESTEAISLAKQGFIVIGVEKNRITFEAAKKNIKRSHQEKNITLINKDIRNFNLDMEFDVIIFSYVLMFMSKEDAYNLIDKYHKKLKLGGEMIIRVLMSDDKLAKSKRKSGKTELFFPTKKELKLLAQKFFANPAFKIIQDKPHGKMKHQHNHSTGYFKIKRSH